jgi:hypothetical protein
VTRKFVSVSRRALAALAIFGCAAFSAVARADDSIAFFKPTSVSGTVNFAGRTYNLPLGKLRETLLRDGLVVVQGNRMPIRVNKWGEVLENFGLFGIRGKASASGPGEIVFKKVGKRLEGRTASPVTAKVRGRYKIFPIWVSMNSRFDTRIKGDKLIMNAPMAMYVRGIKLNGRIRMTAERKEIDFELPGGGPLPTP